MRTLSFLQATRTIVVLCIMVGTAQNAISGGSANQSWKSQHYREHPLVGTIWSADFQSVSRAELGAALSDAPYVLLGEIHNNPDHHRLQAQIIEAVVQHGRRPAIVFEMVPTRMQSRLDRFLEMPSPDPAKLGAVLEWERRGWPTWAMYQPIVETALDAGLTLQAGGLNRDLQRDIGRSGIASLDKQLRSDLQLDVNLTPQAQDALRQEISDSHCGLLPDKMIGPMTQVQRAKDGSLANAMLQSEGKDGAVLIAGYGHARRDWGVPQLITAARSDADVVSVAFLEVDPERLSPKDYVERPDGSARPFDFVFFTPRADLTDRCKELAKHFHKSN